MTRTAARLAELDAISRQRSLTDDEQREVKRLAKKERRYARRRDRRRADPAFREHCLSMERRYRGITDPYTRAEWARVRPRNEAGRFV